jgi:Cytochrome bd terminal oxidase subunit I
MDAIALLLSRLQFAFTISFHIIFPAFTIGLAAWLTVLEALHLKTGRLVYRVVFEFRGNDPPLTDEGRRRTLIIAGAGPGTRRHAHGLRGAKEARWRWLRSRHLAHPTTARMNAWPPHAAQLPVRRRLLRIDRRRLASLADRPRRSRFPERSPLGASEAAV